MKIVLRDERTATDLRRLVVIARDGGLHVDGHDLGDGVEGAFGSREYEWTCDIAADAIPQLVKALGGVVGEDIFEVIRRTCSDDPDRLHRTIVDAKIPHQWWSRIGD